MAGTRLDSFVVCMKARSMVVRVKLSGIPPLQMPYGIVALSATSELFVTEQHGRRVVRITLQRLRWCNRASVHPSCGARPVSHWCHSATV